MSFILFKSAKNVSDRTVMCKIYAGRNSIGVLGHYFAYCNSDAVFSILIRASFNVLS